MHEQKLQRLFRHLVRYSAVSVLATQACGGAIATDTDAGSGGDGAAEADGGGGAPGTGGIEGGGAVSAGGSGGSGVLQPEPFWPDLPLAEFENVCGDNGYPDVAGLNPSGPFDYWGLKRIDYQRPVDGGVTDALTELGTPCSGATDVEACESAVATAEAAIELTESCGGPPYGCQHFIVTTAGDAVRTWMPDEYPEFLGEIDLPVEAALLVHQGTFGGYHACDTGVRVLAGGYHVVARQMTSDCEPIVNERVLFNVTANGTVTEIRRNVAGVSGGCVGRRTEALASCAEFGGSVAGDFFASIAHLEAASVDAFRHLHSELAAHGAPEELLEAALSAAIDETRHAALTGDLARRFGGRPTPPVVGPLPVRELLRMARENAVEGCVRETFGALLATYQSQASRDPDVRRVMTGIASDETRHAALAWRIADWLSTRLTADERAAVAAAQRSAIAELRRELDAEVPGELCRIAGVPERERALVLLAGLERTVWGRSAGALTVELAKSGQIP